MNKATELQFGDLVFGEFPFEDGGSKNRWMFTVKDHGDAVTLLYCTSNDRIQGSVRLGKLADGKVTHVVAWRWETVQKTRLAVGRTQRVALPVPGVGADILGQIKKMAEICQRNPTANGAFSSDVTADILQNHAHRVEIGKAQFAKIATRKAANK